MSEFLKRYRTKRGFGAITFLDRYRQECSLRESSLATEEAIWLGVDKGLGDPPTEASMHLTREMAAELWPLLKEFADKGDEKDWQIP